VWDHCRSLITQLVVANPTDKAIVRELAMIDEHSGFTLAKLGKLNAAFDSYESSLAINEKLVAADRSNAEWGNDYNVLLAV
jgi:hypothetical protein